MCRLLLGWVFIRNSDRWQPALGFSLGVNVTHCLCFIFAVNMYRQADGVPVAGEFGAVAVGRAQVFALRPPARFGRLEAEQRFVCAVAQAAEGQRGVAELPAFAIEGAFAAAQQRFGKINASVLFGNAHAAFAFGVQVAFFVHGQPHGADAAQNSVYSGKFGAGEIGRHGAAGAGQVSGVA